MTDLQLRPLVLEACAAFNAHLSEHGAARAELRSAGVGAARVAALYPLTADEFRAGATDRFSEWGGAGAARYALNIKRARRDFDPVDDLPYRLPEDLRWINPKLSEALSSRQHTIEVALQNIVLVNRLARWFEWEYTQSLPPDDQMWAARSLCDFKLDGIRVGNFIHHFGLAPFPHSSALAEKP